MKSTRKHFLSRLPLLVRKDMEEDIEVISLVLKTKLPDELVHFVVEFAEPRGFVLQDGHVIWTERSITDTSVVHVRVLDESDRYQSSYECSYFNTPFSDRILRVQGCLKWQQHRELQLLSEGLNTYRLFATDGQTVISEYKNINHTIHGLRRSDINITEHGQTSRKRLFWHGSLLGEYDSGKKKQMIGEWGIDCESDCDYDPEIIVFVCDEKGVANVPL